tara:strand:- start:445 stop:1740 length:1296 start_codon:yes stop_codon:yes gene_type:complete
MPYVGKEPVRGQNRELDDISGSFNTSNTAFTMQVGGINTSAGSANQVFINLGGVMQNPGTDFTVASSTITFTTPPASGLSFWGLIQGDAVDINTPADGSVTSSKIASGNLTLPGDVTIPDKIVHDGDTNTAIRFPAADTVSVETGGSERTRVTSAGQVLIGTSTPSTWTSRQLVVGDTSTSSSFIEIRCSNSSTGHVLFADSAAGDANNYTGYLAYNHSSNHMSFHTDGGTERVVIDDTGDLKINDGDLIIGTAGHGIDFSAQTATSATGASTTAELLNHYEEGTFLPFVEGSGGSGSTVTYHGSDNRRGYYIRIGKMVTVWCLVGWTDITNGWSGDLQVGGLPFAHDNTDHSNPNGKAQSVGTFYAQNVTLPKGDDGQVSTYLYGGYSTKPKFIQSDSNGSLEMVSISAGNNMSNSAIKYIQFELTYPAA